MDAEASHQVVTIVTVCCLLPIDTGGGSDSWMRKPRTKFSPDQ